MLLTGPFQNSTCNFNSFSSVLHILMLLMPFLIYFCLSEICYKFFKEIKGVTGLTIQSAVTEGENWRRTLSRFLKLNISACKFFLKETFHVPIT